MIIIIIIMPFEECIWEMLVIRFRNDCKHILNCHSLISLETYHTKQEERTEINRKKAKRKICGWLYIWMTGIHHMED